MLQARWFRGGALLVRCVNGAGAGAVEMVAVFAAVCALVAAARWLTEMYKRCCALRFPARMEMRIAAFSRERWKLPWFTNLVLSLMFADADLQCRWCCSGVRRGYNGGCESGSSMEDGRVAAAVAPLLMVVVAT